MPTKPPSRLHLRFLKKYDRKRQRSDSRSDLQDLRRGEKRVYLYLFVLTLLVKSVSVGGWWVLGLFLCICSHGLWLLYWYAKSIDLLIKHEASDVRIFLGEAGEVTHSFRGYSENVASMNLKGYLRRFKKSRGSLDFYPNDNDLQRLRRVETASISLLYTQLFVLVSYFLSDGRSGDFPVILMSLLCLWQVYMLYTLYFSTKAINALIVSRQTSVDSLI